MIKNSGLLDIIKKNGTASSKGGENDLVANLLKNPQEAQSINSFSTLLNEQVENAEEDVGSLLNKLLEKGMSKGKGQAKSNNLSELVSGQSNSKILEPGVEQVLDPNLEKILGKVPNQTQEVSELISQKFDEVDKEFTKATESFSELDKIKAELSSPKKSGETFYDKHKDIGYKSMFDKKVKGSDAAQELVKVKNHTKQQSSMNNDFSKIEHLMKNKNENFNPNMAHKAYGGAPLVKKAAAGSKSKDNITQNLNEILDQNASLPVGRMKEHSQVISGLNSNPVFEAPSIGKDISGSAPLNFSTLDMNPKADVINQISDYIAVKRYEANPRVELHMAHNDLGNISIAVEKSAGDALKISIQSATQEGVQFFSQNKGELSNALSRAGITVSELKIDTASSFTNTSKDGNSSQAGSQSFSSSQEHFGSQDGQRKHDSQRREEVWSYYQQQQEQQDVA